MSGRAVSRWCGMLVLVLGYAFGASAQDAPGIPDLQNPSDGSLAEPTTILLTWSPADGATAYHLQVSTDMDFSTTVSDQPGLTGTSLTVSGLANAAVYYWQVEASGPGGESGWPDYPQSFTTVIAAPALSTPAANAVNQPVSLTLGWGADSGADSYELQVATTNNFLSPAFDQPGITGTSQTVGSLTNSTLYYWRVLATSSAGDGSVWSSIDSFTTIVQAPGAPGLSSPADNAINQATNPTVAWTAGLLASTYTVRFSPVSDFSSGVVSLSGITGTATSLSSLSNNTVYYWQVQSINIGGATWSAAWSFTTVIAPPDAPALSSPAAGAVNQPLSISLNWDAAARATAYSFQISTDQSFGSTTAAQNGLSGTTGTATLAQTTTLYYWRVIATNRGGMDSGPWSSVWSFTTVPTPPGSPSLLLPVNNDANQVVSPTLIWKTVSGAASYNFQLATTSTFAATIATQTGLVDTFLAIGPLSGNTNYWWRINATNAGGTSNWSKRNFTIPALPAAPGLSLPANNEGNASAAITLSWQSVTGPLNSYELQVSTDNFITTTVNASVGSGTTSYSGPTLASNTYYWRVGPSNGGGQTWSSIWTFTVPTAASSMTLSIPANAAPNVSVNPTLSWNAVAGVPVTSYSIVVSDASGFTDTLAKSTMASSITSYAATLPIGTYYWKVGVLNGGGMTWSTAQSFTIPAAASSVALATPVNNAPNVWRNQTFTWGAVAGVPVTSYNFRLSTVSNFATTVDNQTFGSGTTTYKEIDTLQNNTTYYWQVSATNGGGTTWSATWTFTVPANAGSVTLATPANAAANVSVNPTLSWNAVAGVPVTSYHLQISVSSGFGSTVDAESFGSGTTSYAATLPVGTYYWKVGSLNGGGMTWSTAQSFTIPAAASSVALVTPVNNAPNVWRNQTFSWGAVASVPVTSYNFQLSTVSNFATTVDNQTFGPGTTTYKETDTLQNNATYYWQVSATNGGGTTWSATWTFTVPANAGSVTLATPANAAPNVSVNPTLSWNAVAGVPVTSYTIIVSDASGFTDTLAKSKASSATTSYAATLPVGTYYWKVGSLNGGGMTWSTAQSFTIPAAASSVALATPVNNASNVWRNQTFTWGAVAGVPVTSYNFQLSTVSNFATTVDNQSLGSGITSYKETDTLQNNTTYYWQVAAINGGGTTWSATWTFTVPANAGSVTLATPANAAANVSVNPTLSWNAVAGVPVTSYHLQISVSSGFGSTVDAESFGSGTTSYAATLPVGTYYWKVGSLNGGGMTWSSAQSFTIPAAASSVALATPVNNAPNVWRNQTFSWDAVAGVPVTSYNFQLSTVSNFATTVDNQTFGPGTTTYKETDTLQNNATYYWQVSATNGGGTTWSATWTFTVPANAGSVTLATPANAASNVSVNPTLTWNAVAGVPVTSYHLLISASSGFGSTVDAESFGSATTSYAATLPIGTYYWKVGSLNGGGMTWSTAQSFTIPAAASSVALATPVNNAPNVWRNQTFSWGAVAGVPVTSYNFQLSTVSNFATTVDNQTFGPGTTTYKETDTLQNNQTYYWQVAATNGGGTTWSATWTFTVPANAGSVTLATPANAAPNVSVNPTLTWNAVAGVPVTSYHLQISVSSGFGSTVDAESFGSGTTSYAATLPVGTYYWKVGSLNGGGMTWSSAQSFTIPAAASTVTLSTPVNNASNVWRNQTFKWDAVAGAPVTSYDFQLSTVSNFATTVDNQTFGSEITSYKETDTLQNNATYYWQVSATNGGGTTWSATWTFTVPANAGSVTLATPANAAANVSVNPTLTWNAVAGVPVTSYHLLISASSGFGSTVDAESFGSATTSYAATLPIGTYYWKVGSLNGGGMTWSTAQSFTIPAAASSVALATPVNNASNVWRNQTFTWGAVAGVPVTLYNFQLSTVSSFASTVDNQTFGSGTTTYKEADTLQNNQTYYWKVASTNGGGTTWSATWTFTIPATASSVTLSTPANAAPNVLVNPTLTWNAVAGVPVTSYHLLISASSGFGSTVDAESFGSATTSYAATLPIGTYYWKVGSLNGGGMSWSSAQSFTIPAAASTVTLSTPVNNASNVWRNQTFKWDAVAGAPVTSYDFQLSTASNFATTVDNQTFGSEITSYKETDTLQNNTTYYWQVAATNGGGTTWSATWTFTVPANAGSVTLATPANAALGVALNPTLSWNAVVGVPVNSYTILVSDAGGFSDTLAKSTVASGTTSYAATLTSGTYYWKVGALNGGGMTWSSAQSFTIPNPPGLPEICSPANNAVNLPVAPVLKWYFVDGAQSYTVQVAAVSNFATTLYNSNATDTTQTVAGVCANFSKYYWRVMALGAGGASGWTGGTAFTTIIGAPLPTAPANNADNQSVSPTVTWSALSGTTAYDLQISSAPDFSSTVSDQSALTAPSGSISGLNNNSLYYWHVNATGNGAAGAWSTVWSFTTIAAPVLALPAGGAGNISISPVLSWDAVATATSYHLDVSAAADFSTTVYSQGSLTATSQTVSGLANTTTYYWRIGAKNATGISGWSNVSSFTTTAAAVPASPAGGAVNISISPTFSWGAVATATSYRLDVSAAADFSTTVYSQGSLTATTQAVSGLANATSYYWRIGAKNATGITGWSNIDSFTTVATPVLASPASGTQHISISPVLSWDGVPGATSYHLDVSAAADFSTTVYSQGTLTTTSQEVSGLSNATSYYWRIGSKNPSGISGWSGVSSFTTMATPVLSSPVSGTGNISISPVLTWDDAAGATSYHLDVSPAADFSTTVYSQGSLTATSQTVSGLANATTYYWRIGAKNATGISGWSGVSSFTTFATPILTLPASGSGNISISPVLSWNAAATATSYRLDVSAAADFSTTVYSQGSLTTTSQAVSGLANTTTYYWRIGAKNATGISGWSNVSSFTTIAAAVLASPAGGATNISISPTLTWDAVATATSYHLDVSAAADFSTTVYSQGSLTATSQGISGLANGTAYYWRIGAKNATGISGWSNVSSFTTTAAAVLASPASGATNISISPTLTWDAVATATSYHLDVSAAADFSTTVYSQGSLTATSQAISGLANGTAYYWRIGAKNATGISGWSNVSSFTTTAAAVLASPASGAVNISIAPMLSWDAVATATSYHLDVSPAADFSTTVYSQGSLTATSQTVSGLANATTYYWRIGAKNATGISGWSGVSSFTTFATPVLVSPVSASGNISISPVLGWDGVAGATSYRLDVSAAADFSTTVYSQGSLTTTSQEVSGLTNATTYYWRIGAKNATGISGWSGVSSFTTIAAAVLASPAGGAVNISISPTLTWDAVATATSYHLDVSAAADFSTTVYSQGSLTVTSQTVSGLANATAYYWRIGAKNATGISGWSNVSSFTTTAAAVLASPASGATNISISPTLTWDAVATATSYHLDVSAAADFSTTVYSQGSLTATSQAISGLANGTAYYWRIGAKNATGISGWSNVSSFTTTAAAVLASPASGAVNISIAPMLSWDAVATATSYHLDVSPAADFSTTVYSQGSLTATSQTVSGLANATTYYWRIGAKNATGISGWSGVSSFTTFATPVLVSPVSASGNISISPVLGWDGVAGATSYRLDVSAAADFSTTVYSQGSLTTTSQEVSGLTNATTYYWRIGAKNATGISGWSGVSSFTTIAAAVLASPAGGAVNISISPTLTWDAVATATSYHLDVSAAADFSTTVYSQGSLTATSQTVSGLANATIYYWRIGAKNATGISGWSGVSSFTTTAAAVLASPASGATNISISPTLTWDAVAAATSYHLDVSAAADFSTTVYSQGSLTATSQTVSGLANTTTYYWRIGAKNATGISGWSGISSFTTIAAAVLVSPANGATNLSISPALIWNTVNSATTYRLDVSTSASFSTTVYSQGTIADTSQTVTGLANAATYYWRVGAKNATGISGWSGIQSFTTIIAAPSAPSLATPNNNAQNQAVTLAVAWGAVSTAATYNLQVSTDAGFLSTIALQTGLTGVATSVTGLTNNATYYWRANATNIGGTGAWSTVESFTTIATPALGAPANNAQWQGLSPNFTWGAVSGATNYTLEVSTASGFAAPVIYMSGITAASQTAGILTNNATCYWRVFDSTATGPGGWSSTWSFSTLMATPTLSSPSSSSINLPLVLSLSWGTVGGAATYEVQVSTGLSFTNTVYNQTGITGSSTGISGIIYNTQYYWQVNAMNGAGTTVWSGAWSFTTAPAKPGTVTLVSPSSGVVDQPQTPTLAWQAIFGGTSYSLQVSTAANFSTTVYSQAGLTGTSQSPGPLSDSTLFYWRVSASNAGGTGIWSSVWSFTSIPNIPTTPVLSLPSSGLVNTSLSPTLSWAMSTRAASYSLEVATSSNFGSPVVNLTGLSSLSQAVGPLTDSVEYYWRVEAVNTAGTAWSSVWNFTTIPNIPGSVALSSPVSATQNTSSSPTLSWSLTPLAASFTLQVSTNAAFASTVSSMSGLSGLSLQIGSLTDSVEYYWRVAATNAAGTGAWSSVWNFTTIPNIPGAVVLSLPASGTQNTSTTPTLSWSAISHAASFTLQLSTGSNFASTVMNTSGVSALSLATVALTDSMEYYWRVAATNAAGTGAWSPVWNFTTIPNIPGAVVLSSPVSGTQNTLTTLTLGWNVTPKAASFTLQVSTSADFAITVLSTNGMSGMSQQIGPMINNVQYYWRVAASNAAGTGVWSSVWSFTTIATPALALPVNGSSNISIAPVLSWDAVATATSYHLDVSAAADFSTTVYSQGSLTATSQALAGLANSATYYWRVGAKNALGVSGWSGVSSFTTTASAVLASPSNGAMNISVAPVLSWDAVATATSYHLDVSAAADFSTTVYSQGNLTATSQALSRLTNAATYYWRVGAKNASGISGWSGVSSFTTMAAAVLASPASGSGNISIAPVLSWNAVATATSYHLDVSAASDFSTTIFSQGSLTATSQTVSMLANATTYFWRVGAKNATGISGWSAVSSFTTTAAAVSVSPTSGAVNIAIDPILSWNAVATATSYHLDISPAADFSTTVYSQGSLTATSQAVSGLANATTYYWRVGAKNATGITGWSGVSSFTTMTMPVLGSPATGAGNISVAPVLSWEAVAAATSYHLDVSSAADFSSTVYSQGSLTTTSQTVGGLANAATYYWRIGAKNTSGISGWSGVSSFTTSAAPVLASPANGTGNISIVPVLSWDGVAGATSYHLDVSATADFSTTVYSQGSLTATSQMVGGLANAATYYWRIGSKNATGISGWSTVFSFTTIAVPVLASPENGTGNISIAPVLGWNAVATATSYHLDVSAAADFSTTVYSQGSLTGTSQAVSGLGNAATYYWRVGAKNATGITGWSNVASFTTITTIVLASPASGAGNVSIAPDLSWDAVATATSYHLDVSSAADFSTTVYSQGSLTATSQAVRGLANATTYYWRVGSKIPTGISGWSGVSSFTTSATPVLALPAGGAGNISIAPVLSWNGLAGAATYHLDVSSAADFSTTVYSQGSLTATSQAVSGLANVTTYYWRVGSKNTTGISGWSGVSSFTTSATPVLALPAGGAGNISIAPVLSWNALAGAATYHLDVSSAADFSTTVYSRGSLTATSQAISGLANVTAYYWRVGSKNTTGISGWSGVSSFTTTAAPVLATPASGAGDVSISPTVSWNAVATATSYHLDVSSATDFSTTVYSRGSLTATSQSVSGLANGITYYWRVGAKNATGISGWSGVSSFTTTATAVLVSPANGSGNISIAPVLSWNAVALATSYHLDVSAAADFSTTVYSQGSLTATSQAVSGLANAMVYYWRVGAKNATGISGWSGVASFTTTATPVLASPVSGAGNISIAPVLNWNAVATATSYHLEVSAAADFSTTVYSQGSLTATSQAVSGLANSAAYYWRVGAKNATGISGWSSVSSFTTIALPVLALPASGAENVSTSPTLSWTSMSSVISWHLAISTSANFATTVYSQGGLTAISQTVSGLANATVYYWRIGAKNATGISGWSAAGSFTTVVAAPVLAYPSDKAINIPTSMTLSWNPAANAISYLVEVSSSATFANGSIIDSVTQSSLSRPETGFTTTREYYWRVRAMNAGGCGAWSVDSFTTVTPMAIAVPEGWNMIGLNIHPADSTVASVFNAPKGFILVKDIAGDAYIPSLTINGIGTMSTGQGYQVYTSVTDTIRTLGSVINVAATPLSLSSEWNMIACLSQTNVSIETVFSGIEPQVLLVKDNSGNVYWPYFGVDNIDTMRVGQGYLVCMQDPEVLTFPTGQVSKMAANRTMLRLPVPQHYALALNTGNSATLLARKIQIGAAAAGDSCEVGAFNAQGKLVGSGTVRNGIAAFALWGVDPQSATKPGLKQGEKITFKLWDGSKEYPLEFQSTTGDGTTGYKVNGIFTGMLSVPAGFLITRFDLARVYPNPFKEFLRIAFDVPTIDNVSVHSVEIDLFDMKGTLVHQIAKGEYNAGHYVVSWNGEGVNGSSLGSGFYVIRMKAQNFDKIVRLIRMR